MHDLKTSPPILSESNQTERKRANSTANNFNVLRFVAASLVILSHGFELPTGLVQHDWAYEATGRALSWYAVNAFFVISGYLIFNSWERNPSARFFLWARFLRIVPGLLVMLLVTVSVLGVFFTTLTVKDFITSATTIKYFFGCLSIVFVKYELPGVFSSNPIHAVNGSLWTLRYEIFCYAAVAIAGCASTLNSIHIRKAGILTCILASSLALIWLDSRGAGNSNTRLGMLYELIRLAMCFQLGAFYAAYASLVTLRPIYVIAWAVLAITTIDSVFYTTIANIATASLVIWFAQVPRGRWIQWYRLVPDYSYGLYIYGYPVQQATISLFPGISISASILLSYCLALLFAAFSWHLVEKPSLSLKQRLPRF